ncbi:hypothetical protein VTI74DRAFT_10166 [Chaetomium olivicolor]
MCAKKEGIEQHTTGRRFRDELARILSESGEKHTHPGLTHPTTAHDVGTGHDVIEVPNAGTGGFSSVLPTPILGQRREGILLGVSCFLRDNTRADTEKAVPDMLGHMHQPQGRGAVDSCRLGFMRVEDVGGRDLKLFRARR